MCLNHITVQKATKTKPWANSNIAESQFSHTHTHTLSLSLSLSHTHTHTHTHTNTHTLMDRPQCSNICRSFICWPCPCTESRDSVCFPYTVFHIDEIGRAS